MPQAGTVAVSPFLVRMHPNAWRISRVSSFLTTAPNAVVEPIHPKAMPVILTRRIVARGATRKIARRPHDQIGQGKVRPRSISLDVGVIFLYAFVLSECFLKKSGFR